MISTDLSQEYAALTIAGCIEGAKKDDHPNVSETKGINSKEKFEKILNKYTLIDQYPNKDNGYHGYAYRNNDTGEIIIIHEGSHDPSNISP